MPCRSDYLEASGQELESQRVCKLIVYLFHRLNQNVDNWIIEASTYYYGNLRRLDEATKILCEACRGLTKEESDKYIYDGRNANARKLADWWERHQEWDKRRVKEENEAIQKVRTRDRALAKLTVKEMKALGLIEE